MRALIVDDVEVGRYILRGYLEDMGYAVTDAANEDQTRAALQSGVYDLVMLDWYLNDTTAEPLVFDIRNSTSKKARIVVLSGVATDEEIQEIRKLGIDSFIGKPTTKDKVKQAVQV